MDKIKVIIAFDRKNSNTPTHPPIGNVIEGKIPPCIYPYISRNCCCYAHADLVPNDQYNHPNPSRAVDSAVAGFILHSGGSSVSRHLLLTFIIRTLSLSIIHKMCTK